jgi:uncharacterized membrane protein
VKIFKHPIHVMLIHFPSALLPMDFVCYGLLYYTHQASFADASFYALIGAVVSGWLAAIFGMSDIIKIPREKVDAMQKALIHGSINVSVIIVYTILAFKVYKQYPTLPAASLSFLLLKGHSFAL